MLIVIGGTKGGTGKSTLATNLCVGLALGGRQVMLVDSDRQATARLWSDVRAGDEALPPVLTVQKQGKLYKTLRDLEQRYDDVVVDAGGFDSVELRTALVAAEVLYSPVRASQSDLWTLEDMSTLVGSARDLNEPLRAVLVLSMAPTNPAVREVEQARLLLAEYPVFEVARTVLCDRKVYRDAMFRGMGVLELADAKAKAELGAFMEEVMRHANGGRETRDDNDQDSKKQTARLRQSA